MHNNQQKFIDYLVKEKNYSPHTTLAYQRDLEFFDTFLQQNYLNISLEEVLYVHIRSWIVFLVQTQVSPITINRKIASLKAFYLFLLKTEQIITSPLLKHTALKTPKKLQIPFSETELNDVLNHISYKEGYQGERDKLIIDLFYTTGIRRSELINLQIQDINLSNATIKVTGKRDKQRIIPILPTIQKQLQHYIIARAAINNASQTNYLFLLKNANKLNETFVYRLINTYFSTVSEKVKKSPHMLRHTFATHMLNNGADLNSIKELLGHASLASTQVYTHTSLEELKKIYQNTHPRSSD